MKALDWMKYLESQGRQYGKTLFRVAELANVAGRNAHALNIELARLVKKEVLVRYATGVYGLPNRASLEALVSVLDGGAYLTGIVALSRHNLVTQMAHEITCFTNRRHNRSRTRMTPFGRIVFVCVHPRIYQKPPEGFMAPPEQALCDFVHLNLRQGLEPSTLVTFRGLKGLSKKILNKLWEHYPSKVKQKTMELLGQG
jgi:hypothetical protein